jgi:chromate reductase
MHVAAFELHDVPLDDGDVERRGDPAPVQRLKAAIAEADALLVATPDYPHSTSGVLKNALDWASRPAGASPLRGKPVAVVGATPGRTGTARTQADVRKVLAYDDVHLLHRPGVLIAEARRVFAGGCRGGRRRIPSPRTMPRPRLGVAWFEATPYTGARTGS